MKLAEIDNQKVWEDFVQEFKPNNFLTSWNWGEFNELMEEKIFRLGFFEKEDLVGVCLAIMIKARRGNFLLCPAGPLLKNFNKESFEFFLREVKGLSKRENLKFIRLRPLAAAEEVEKLFTGLVKSPTHVHAQTTWLLDLTSSEEELLAGMRKTTRYLVKQANRLGVNIEIREDLEAVKIFEKLQEETVKQHHFVPFSDKYLENEFNAFSKEHEFKIFLASKDNEVLAAALVVFYGDSAFYHHGASLRSKIPASYFLQWEVIKHAKSLEKKYYNFWGIAPTISEKHPWYGLTQFKQGFGGFKTEFIWPRDLPLSPMYPVINLFEKARNYKRGLANG